MSSFKETNIGNAGTSIKFGADDLDKVTKLLNGVTTSIPPVKFKSTNKVGFWDSIAFFRNQADSKSTIIRGQTNVPTTDVELTLPPITGNDTLPAIGLAQTWAELQRFNSGVQFQEISTPSNPSSGLHKVFVNASNGHLQKLNTSGVLKDYDITAATIPMDIKDAVLALRDYDCRFFAVGVFPTQTFYAVKYDGTVISTGTNPATVLQAALDAIGPGHFLITAPAADPYIHFQSGFTGITLDAYQSIEIGGGTNLNVPVGYTGVMFKVTGPNVEIRTNGGYVNEDEPSPQRLWTAIQVGTGTSVDDINGCVFSGLRFYLVGTCVKINQGSTGKVYSNLFEDLSFEDNKIGVEFVASNNSSTNENVFKFCNTIGNTGTTTDGFKNVAGNENQFLHCDCKFFDGSMSEMSISSNGVNTLIFGGSCTGEGGTFTDNGTDTYIDDKTHTEWKLKNGTITPSALTANTNNWNPSGFNDRINTIRASSNAMWNITGLVPPVNSKNRIINMLNVGTNDIMFINESTSSTAANRFKLNIDLKLMPDQGVLLFYDNTSLRWRLLADAGAGHAMLAEDNVFTGFNQFQNGIELFSNQSDQLLFTRTLKTIGTVWGAEYWALDSTDNFLKYGMINAKIIDNVLASADSEFDFSVLTAGVERIIKTPAVTADDTFAVLKLPQTFTDTITFKKNANDYVKIFKDNSSTGQITLLDLDYKNASSAEVIGASLGLDIFDATAGSEDAAFFIKCMVAGAQTSVAEFYNGGMSLGSLLRVNLDGSTGITAPRNYTFPDVTTKLAGVSFGNVFLTKQFLQIDAASEFIELYRTDNAVSNTVDLAYYLDSSTGVKRNYGRMECEIDDATNTSEDSHFNFKNMWNGTLAGAQKLYGTGDMDLIHRANTTNDTWAINLIGLDSGSALQTYCSLYSKIITNTAGSEDGELRLDQVNGGTIANTHKFLNNGKILVGRDGTNFRGVGSYFHTTANDAVFNTSTAENTLYTFTVKGNVMGVDGHAILKMGGYILQNQATGTTYTFRIKVGGTTVWQDTLGGSIAQSATKRPWFAEIRFYPANESTTSARMTGFMTLNDTTAPTTGQGSTADATIAAQGAIRAEAITWTFSSDTAILVSCQMSVSNAATEIMMDNATLEYAPS